MSNIQFPLDLIEALNNGRLVPFVGAGVSMSVKRKNSQEVLFPSWPHLLTKSAEEIQQQGKNDNNAAQLIEAYLGFTGEDNKYLETAELAKKTLGNGLWNGFLKKQLSFNKSDCDPASLNVAQAIWRLNSPLVITTNYDKVLDWACPEEKKKRFKPLGYSVHT